MKLIVAGSRTVDKYLAYFHYHKFLLRSDVIGRVTELVTGCCPYGPDQVPFLVSEVWPYLIPVIEFPANWKEYGRGAGVKRNREMAEYGDHLLLIWDGKSRGSTNMGKEMKLLNKPVTEIIIPS